MNWTAVRTCIKLSVLFLVVYGSCNWLTSLRSDVDTLYFQWEHYIPFVPLMIIPYMSIDLFFIAAPFLCRDEQQRRTLSNRITTAILIGGACFLLFPLRFAFERPWVEGPLGIIFNNFRKMDLPFNEFPSLHIALRTILAPFYVQRTRGLLRWATRIWFVLIGLSTLLTYQHHFVDIVGGFVLGALCIHLWQEKPMRTPVTVNRRVGSYYLGGAIILTALAFIGRPEGIFLLWPAMSLWLVAGAYFGLGPGIFRKQDGKLPLTTWLLFWPVLLMQYVSLKIYSHQCKAWNEVTPQLWIGRRLSAREAQEAIDQGVTAILDLTGEFSECEPFRNSRRYLSLPIMDLTAPTSDQIDQAIQFVEQSAATGIVYVHCKAGYSRTAAITCAYLLECGKAQNAEQAISIVKTVRPRIVIRPEVHDMINGFAGRAITSNRDSSPNKVMS